MADKEDKRPKKPKGRDRRPPTRRQGRKAAARPRARPKAPPRRPRRPKEAARAGAEGPARLRKEFDEVIRKKLIEQFGYKNAMEVPRIDKIVLNMGVGEGVADRKKVDLAAADLGHDRRPEGDHHQARKSIATFKLRENQPIGCKVTLRKARMYEFLDRLVNIALPRVRDFRGLNPKSFDGRGNYTLGIKEHIIFPEIDYDKATDHLGHGHHRLHDGEERRRGARAARGFQFPVPAVRGFRLPQTRIPRRR